MNTSLGLNSGWRNQSADVKELNQQILGRGDALILGASEFQERRQRAFGSSAVSWSHLKQRGNRFSQSDLQDATSLERLRRAEDKFWSLKFKFNVSAASDLTSEGLFSGDPSSSFQPAADEWTHWCIFLLILCFDFSSLTSSLVQFLSSGWTLVTTDCKPVSRPINTDKKSMKHTWVCEQRWMKGVGGMMHENTWCVWMHGFLPANFSGNKTEFV